MGRFSRVFAVSRRVAAASCRLAAVSVLVAAVAVTCDRGLRAGAVGLVDALGAALDPGSGTCVPADPGVGRRIRAEFERAEAEGRAAEEARRLEAVKALRAYFAAHFEA